MGFVVSGVIYSLMWTHFSLTRQTLIYRITRCALRSGFSLHRWE